MKKVYTCFCTDVIHEGHLNIINEAKKYGEVIVGVLSDEAMIRFNRFPTVSFQERLEMAKNIEGVSRVIVQDEIMYDKVIEEIRPDYVIHGNNWQTPPLLSIRNNVASLLEKFGGEIIDVPYTFNENVALIDQKIKEKLSMPEYRRKRLKQLIKLRGIVKTLEVHSGLTGLIAEKTVVEHDGDFDTGGKTVHLVYTVRTLERMGVSAIIIEDKVGLKKNSLFGTDVEQTQDTIEHFCQKISTAKKVQLTDDFMIIARIESLILEKGMEDALERARAFVKAGADGIMIHSRKKDPAEILEFCDKFRAEDKTTPIVVVPSSFNTVTEAELAQHGVNIVIYANQLTRSAFPAMEETAKDILRYHRAKEVDDRLMPIKKIISLIDEL